MDEVPEALSLKDAYRAAFLLVDAYIALEQKPDEGLVLLHQYMQSDPARWEDWLDAVRGIPSSLVDPLSENIGDI